MKCTVCDHYNKERSLCMLASDGTISEVDDPVCLLRLQISLLRAMNENLLELIDIQTLEDDEDDPDIGSSDWWKQIE